MAINIFTSFFCASKKVVYANSKYCSILLALLFCFTIPADAQQTTGVDPANKSKTDTSKIPLPTNKNVTRPNAIRKEISGVGENADAQSLDKMQFDTLTDMEKKVFGYLIFHNNNVSFTPNLNMATPKTYVVGPGDVLLLQVYGIAQNRYSLTVSPEGVVNIPDIGLAKVGGFSIDAVKSILLNKLAVRYSGISGANPNTFLELTLSNVRTIKVNMVGEIYKPGTYSLPSYINVFNALFAAGGPTVKGTFRYVQVYRAGKMVGEVDIYEFLIKGKTTGNIRLEDDDVILVRPAGNHIELTGEIRTPGIFELKPKESFTDLLQFSGGFTDMAYKEMVSVTRKGLIEKQVFDLPKSQFQKANMNDGDSVSVSPILDRFSNRVQVSGAVNRPGPFALAQGMTVKDLIQKADGLKGDAFKKRALLYRTREDFTQEVLTIDLTDSSLVTGIASIQLRREDVLSIANIYDIQEEYYIRISGEVNNSGVYAYADSMTVGDLILKAEGFKYSASSSFIEIVRRVDDPGKVAEIITVSIDKDLHMSDADKKINLKPFDQVFVRATPGFQLSKTATIDGEVLYKGVFAIDKKEMRISDLLARAGGLTKYAYVPGATLIRKTKKFIPSTLAEREIANLSLLKENLEKDKILSNTESNKILSKRIDNKIKQNKEAVNKEQEIKDKELQKQNLLKESTSTLSSSNAVSLEEKEQELVALDLDQVIQNPGSSADLVLKDGDVLNIPEKLETVSIKGGVLYPVSVRYEPSVSFKEYINRSGGYSTRAIKNKAYVLQANGKVQRVKTVLFFKVYPKIEPGAEIFVPATLQDKPPFNYAATVSIVTGFISSTLTLIFLLKTL